MEQKGDGGEEARIGARLLQDLVWSWAPSGDEELRVLKRLVKSQNKTGGRITLKDHRDKAYVRARNAILNTKALRSYAANPTAPPPPPPPLGAKESGPKLRALTDHDVAARIHDRLQAHSLDDYHKIPESPAPPPPLNSAQQEAARAIPLAGCMAGGASRSLDGLIDYVIHNFHYRYVMVDDYLNAFTYSAGRCVDLIVASLVDYDWWLSGGRGTKTSLKTQVEVMEQISILSRGQVHGLVPFDPFREVAYRAGKGNSNSSSLALVQDAIQNRGCIGVKLYPPMGFAPLGNADLGNYWSDQDLPAWVKIDITYEDQTVRSFGERLDEALRDFYHWCSEHEVPIMAHSSMSNGSASKFAPLAAAQYWQKAIGEFPKLRINFGHLGDFSDTLDQGSPPEAVKFLDLMADVPGKPGEHAFADTGYFSAIMADGHCLTDRLKAFYSQIPATGNAPLANRLMYGTDWNLLISQGNIKEYFANFTQAFEEIDKRALPENGHTASQRFFGYNAVEWLGIADGQARTRLDDFYKRNGLDATPPGWLAKLDKTRPTNATKRTYSRDATTTDIPAR